MRKDYFDFWRFFNRIIKTVCDDFNDNAKNIYEAMYPRIVYLSVIIKNNDEDFSPFFQNILKLHMKVS